MQTKLMPTVFLTLSALAIAPFVVPAIAHQQQHQSTASDGEMQAMIHLDPNDSPSADVPSATWFVLMTADGSNIPLADCNCQAMVHDSRDQAIIHHLPLSATMVDGKAAIATEITFPIPGSYTVVLSGESQNNRFEPFEIRFPVTAITPNSSY